MQLACRILFFSQQSCYEEYHCGLKPEKHELYALDPSLPGKGLPVSTEENAGWVP
jgi:hypothetical protein